MSLIELCINFNEPKQFLLWEVDEYGFVSVELVTD